MTSFPDMAPPAGWQAALRRNSILVRIPTHLAASRFPHTAPASRRMCAISIYRYPCLDNYQFAALNLPFAGANNDRKPTDRTHPTLWLLPSYSHSIVNGT